MFRKDNSIILENGREQSANCMFCTGSYYGGQHCFNCRLQNGRRFVRFIFHFRNFDLLENRKINAEQEARLEKLMESKTSWLQKEAQRFIEREKCVCVVFEKYPINCNNYSTDNREHLNGSCQVRLLFLPLKGASVQGSHR